MDLKMKLTLCVSCCMLLLCPTLSQRRGFFRGDSEKKPKNYLTPPKIKTQIRILRNFQHGSEATITLVFQSTRPVYIRWFKKEPGLSLEGSEVPGYFPVDGDSRFWVEHLTSNDVTSATLHISPYKAEFPDSYETIITTTDDTAQYNIRTNIKRSVPYKHDYIYSPEWLIVPKNKVFQTGGFLEVSCQAIVPLELAPSDGPMNRRYPPFENNFNSDNELIFNRFIGQLMPNEPEDRIIQIGGLYDREDYANKTEQGVNDPEILSSYRKPTKFDHVIYDARLRTTNATLDRQGIYQCNLLRRDQRGEDFDKSYVNALVTIKGKKSPYLPLSNTNNKSVKTLLKPCNLDDDDELTKLRLNNVAQSVLMTGGQKGCVRCISMGDPKPKIELLQRIASDGFAVVSRADILEVKSVNVASGGVVETTFIFLNPQIELINRYKCRGSNWKMSSDAEFDLKVS